MNDKRMSFNMKTRGGWINALSCLLQFKRHCYFWSFVFIDTFAESLLKEIETLETRNEALMLQVSSLKNRLDGEW